MPVRQNMLLHKPHDAPSLVQMLPCAGYISLAYRQSLFFTLANVWRTVTFWALCGLLVHCLNAISLKSSRCVSSTLSISRYDIAVVYVYKYITGESRCTGRFLCLESKQIICEAQGRSWLITAVGSDLIWGFSRMGQWSARSKRHRGRDGRARAREEREGWDRRTKRTQEMEGNSRNDGAMLDGGDENVSHAQI